MPTVKFSDPLIKSLSSNGKKREEFYDEYVGGLTLRVTHTGHKSFGYRYRFSGNAKRFTIGSYPTIKLTEARRLAKELSIKVKTGIDPLAELQRNKRKAKPVTVAELSNSFIENYLPSKKPSTQSSYKCRINSKIVPALGNIPVKELSKSDVKKLLEKIAYKDGKGTNSNRVRAILSKMLSYAAEKDWIDINFMRSVKKVSNEVSRDRYYSDAEIREIWKAFESQEEPMQSLLKMLLICGQRLSETSQMKWEDINEENVWTIQSGSNKAGRTHAVPLPHLAIDILKNLKESATGEYVFESTRKKGSPISHFGAVIDRVRSVSKVDDYINHDLRRTFASNLAKLKFDRTLIGKILNHAQMEGGSKITAIYDRYEYMEEKRNVLLIWNEKLGTILKR